MKKFAGTKPLIQIKLQCVAAGVAFDDYGFRKSGHDYIALGVEDKTEMRADGSPLVRTATSKVGGWVMFNTFNGTFYGETPKKRDWHHPLVSKFCPPPGVEFNSRSTEFEAEPWFQALLSFFYVEKEQPGAEKPKASAVDFTLGGTALLEKA